MENAMNYRGVAIGMIMVSAVVMASPVGAAEARPWLCRAKPVFSSSKPMSYQASKHDGGRWLMTFMRFDPSGQGHDGFTVVSSQDVAARSEGTLQAGQWYAVALFRSGGHWICPGNAGENERPSSGVLTDLCYGEEPGECAVNLTVRPQ
jgi:hypothetical protein